MEFHLFLSINILHRLTFKNENGSSCKSFPSKAGWVSMKPHWLNVSFVWDTLVSLFERLPRVQSSKYWSLHLYLCSTAHIRSYNAVVRVSWWYFLSNTLGFDTIRILWFHIHNSHTDNLSCIHRQDKPCIHAVGIGIGIPSPWWVLWTFDVASVQNRLSLYLIVSSGDPNIFLNLFIIIDSVFCRRMYPPTYISLIKVLKIEIHIVFFLDRYNLEIVRNRESSCYNGSTQSPISAHLGEPQSLSSIPE